MAADNDEIRFGLFIKKNGRPCQIILDGLDGPILTKVQKKVMDGGGIVLKKETADANGNLILFSHKDAFSNQKATVDVFDYKYIEDCFEQNQILMNLMDYLVGQSKYEKYEPLKIMYWDTKWTDIKKKSKGLIQAVEELRVNENDIMEDSQNTFIEENQENVPHQEQEVIEDQRKNPPPPHPDEGEEISDIESDDVMKEPSKANWQLRAENKKTAEAAAVTAAASKSTTTESSGSGFRKVVPSRSILQAVRERTKEKEAIDKVSAWMTSNKRNIKSNRDKASDAPSIISTIADKDTARLSILNTTKNGRRPYSRREQESIVKDIVRNRAYNRLRGIEYWKDMEIEKRACGGDRTWQSMKEHFRKKIAPMIHLFGGLMDSQELENFKAYHEGQHVEYSEESSQVSKISDSASIGDDQENDGTESSEFESITKRVQSTPKTTMPKKATKNKDSSPSKEVRASSSHEKDDSDEEIEIAIQRLNKRSPDKENNLRKRKKLFHQAEILTQSASEAETPGRQENDLRKARKDYVNIIDPVPSGSKAKNVPITFKKPPTPAKSLAKTKKTDDDEISLSSADNDNLSTTSSSCRLDRNPYSRSEENKIVRWIIENRRFTEVGGIAMWKILESSNSLPNRSGQSMKERFRKHILPKIDLFDISEDDKKAFKNAKSQNARKTKR